ncbi:hypothetical protein SRB5_26350 [Streptomyces sp. RB5]|uniref:Thiopeptide-type bacteriocin biosynthesis domain-containing protein n=1 Tax=Streptomyces smaragdinus TaxID=2585196 RepID=A0A7K0CGA0_9ACTN|nr:hypothetical protein [Streptomyces smaragdinus]MQY12501.1 hypothetical protein [Streptomyces smaragdinus]
MGADAPTRERAVLDSAQVAGVRLYTRAPLTLSWLSRSVVPVARSMQDDGVPIVYLRRGWLHGTHVDIVARGSRQSEEGWRRIADRLDAGVLDPSTALSDEKYLAQAREFGRLEAVPPPYLPMREHGAVRFLTADDLVSAEPRLDRLRDIASNVMSGPLLRAIDDLAGRREDPAVRLAEAFTALADTHVLGAGYGVFSLRSHAEAFFAWAKPTADARPAFAKRLAAESARLRPVVEERLGDRPSPAAAAWRTAFAYCAGALDSSVADGTLSLELLDSITASQDRSAMGPPGAPEAVPTGDSPDSAFHRVVDESGVIADPPKWFASYRLLVNLFYQQLPLLTVSPMQRYYMCYAISELVDDVLGESWQNRLSRQRGDVR